MKNPSINPEFAKKKKKNEYERLTLVERREVEVWKVTTQLCVAGRLFKLAVCFTAVKLQRGGQGSVQPENPTCTGKMHFKMD